AHEGQKRKSGEPFLIHPLEVAKILTQLKMDISSLIAAILHDTVEDTILSYDDIKASFGVDVAEIVDGVTKISKIKISNQEDRQAENYRKMIIAMSKDIRVIMVKLADRINNMRTLQFMSEARQVGIAQETLDIYAPIAGRMGIYQFKEELEELSLKFLKPEIYSQLATTTKRLEKLRELYMARVKDALTNSLRVSIPQFDIFGRIKRPYSVYRKMLAQQIELDDVHDLMAFRVMVSSIEQCYEVLGIIHSLWKPIQGRFKDYIAMPKANSYQSLHTTVLCFDAERVEFQIRTHEMNEIADKGIAAHWKYKDDGRLDTKDEAKFRWLRHLMDWQSELKDSLEFVDTFKLDLFEDEIFVFTPNGDIKNLPFNATPVDFAYSIHSNVGERCAGARVNGRIVSINHKLDSGDTIEIITKKDHVPSKDWLDFVVSTRAKTKIRGFIRKQQRTKSILIGRNIFETACQKAKITPPRITKDPAFKTYLESKDLLDIDDFYQDLAYAKINAKEVIGLVCPKEEPLPTQEQENENVIKKIFNKISARHKNIILVDSMDDILVVFGKCCSPVRGDPIVGYVTRGR
ncbi:MAG TPA: bifunctional (p)ppGpp synthetase/guanosine-3',5'-bis(diphosphate) 3'-pyrophosphohydrolase, partial [bacterium]|nr:bifunctional (p)ppGpp synthetase/guanosine-3',5'-bis(diphosphate) 3'-pyrophosphohydrolase [bacterium]